MDCKLDYQKKLEAGTRECCTGILRDNVTSNNNEIRSIEKLRHPKVMFYLLRMGDIELQAGVDSAEDSGLGWAGGHEDQSGLRLGVAEAVQVVQADTVPLVGW